jgi:hypothetical protein
MCNIGCDCGYRIMRRETLDGVNCGGQSVGISRRKVFFLLAEYN